MKPSQVVQFFELVARLKALQRKGWVRSGVCVPETVASHSYGVAMLALLLGDGDAQGLKLALVHDLAESLVGDITPKCGITPREKAVLEDEAFRKIRDDVLSGSEAGCELYALFREYEEANTPAAVFVHQLDKLDMVLQAFTYENTQENMELTEFFEACNGIQHEKLREICSFLLQQRQRH
jgi:putative hydrolase of HD superfamily